MSWTTSSNVGGAIAVFLPTAGTDYTQTVTDPVGISDDTSTVATGSSPLKVWNGTDWVEGVAKVWSGSAWLTGVGKVWNGSAWVP
jgi:hypothetical protein